MTYAVSTVAEIASLPDLEVNDIIVHKQLQYAVLVFELQKDYPDIEVMYVHPGTDLFTKYGYNTSIVLGGLT